MKAIKPRAKSKKSNGRFARVKFSTKEPGDNIGPDLSELRKPIDISVSSLIEVTKLLEIGGEEIKSILSYECDVVYECRVCRSLFRSLANFISHKRVYCVENFNVALYRQTRNDRIIATQSFLSDVESKEDNKSKEDDNSRILRSQVVRNSSKKDLTSVLDRLQRKRFEDTNEDFSDGNSELGKSGSSVTIQTAGSDLESNKAKHVLLEAIDSTKTAVYQTVTTSTTDQSLDLMKAQMIELQSMAGKDTAILNADGCSMDSGQLEKHDNPLQLYGSDDEEGIGSESQCTRDLVCSVCNAKFATRKTLTYHMKSLHVSYRTCYPCPCCDNTFANTWSVYRHLFKVHRKSNVQVRKLRSQIQEKAFRKETTGAEDIEKENARTKTSGIPEQQPSNNTQEWMEHLELDLELQRCGGCGRRFDRRAALISHSQFCQKRAAACNEAAAGNKSKRLNKTPSPNNIVDANNVASKEITERTVLSRAQTSKKRIPQKNNLQHQENSDDLSAQVSNEKPPDVTHNSELSIRVENVSRISDADWEMIGSNTSRSPPNGTAFPDSDITTEKSQTVIDRSKSPLLTIPDSPEIIFTSIDKARTVAISFGSKKRRVSLINNSNDLSNSSTDNDSSAHSSPSKDREREVNNLDAMTLMENRIATIANLRKLQCLPCRRKFTSMTNLRRHMAVHIGWHRYRCKLCDFKCFVKCDCVAHCNKVHDAKNNRAVIADMVIQIPPDQSVLAQEIMMDLSNSQGNISEPELIDVSELSPKSVDAVERNGDSNGLKCSEDESNEKRKPIDGISRPVGESRLLDESISVKKDDKYRQRTSPEKKQSETRERVEKDPDLRKIMEVIFGNAEDGAATRGDLMEVHEAPSRTKSTEDLESIVKTNETTESSISNDNPKTRTSAGSTATKLDDTRPQRPTRNRVKPVHEDFIYDLTELIRKESAIHRAAALTAQKTLKKKHLNQLQAATAESESNSGDVKSETEPEIQKLNNSGHKMPGLLSIKKGDSISYNGKLSSLKQAEVKLNPLNDTILSKNVAHTKISVSSHK